MSAYVISDESKMTDIYKTDERYKKRILQIRDWNISERDKQLIFSFLRRKELEGMSYRQLLRYTDVFKRFLRTKKTFENIEEQDLENFLIDMQNLKSYSRQKGWYCMKKFLEYMNQGELFKNFKIHFETKKLRPKEEILTEEEIEKVINMAKTLREKAFISVLWEGGYRIGEILTAKIKHIQFFDNYCKIIVQGKTGWRNPPLVVSTPLLKELVKDRDKEEFVFDISYTMANNLMKRLGRKANINKNINQQLLRSSAATRDANYLTDAQLNLKYGWQQGSRTSMIYVRLSGRGLDEAILKMHGIEPQASEEFEKLKRSGIG